jgi:tRNA modification GTPase
MKRLNKKPVLAIINKIDLMQKIDRQKLAKKFTRLIEVSAKKLKNINLLEEEVANLVYEGKVRDDEPVLVSNFRHIESLKKAQKLIEEGVDSLDNKLPAEFVAQDLKDALLCLDAILGKEFSEDLLDRIFNEFCIGK